MWGYLVEQSTRLYVILSQLAEGKQFKAVLSAERLHLLRKADSLAAEVLRGAAKQTSKTEGAKLALGELDTRRDLVWSHNSFLAQSYYKWLLTAKEDIKTPYSIPTTLRLLISKSAQFIARF